MVKLYPNCGLALVLLTRRVALSQFCVKIIVSLIINNITNVFNNLLKFK